MQHSQDRIRLDLKIEMWNRIVVVILNGLLKLRLANSSEVFWPYPSSTLSEFLSTGVHSSDRQLAPVGCTQRLILNKIITGGFPVKGFGVGRHTRPAGPPPWTGYSRDRIRKPLVRALDIWPHSR
jgi:hypothetical protein